MVYRYETLVLRRETTYQGLYSHHRHGWAIRERRREQPLLPWTRGFFFWPAHLQGVLGVRQGVGARGDVTSGEVLYSIHNPNLPGAIEAGNVFGPKRRPLARRALAQAQGKGGTTVLPHRGMCAAAYKLPMSAQCYFGDGLKRLTIAYTHCLIWDPGTLGIGRCHCSGTVRTCIRRYVESRATVGGDNRLHPSSVLSIQKRDAWGRMFAVCGPRHLASPKKCTQPGFSCHYYGFATG